ncbi:hypothetical protein D3C76_1666500 [compost metagenome]
MFITTQRLYGQSCAVGIDGRQGWQQSTATAGGHQMLQGFQAGGPAVRRVACLNLTHAACLQRLPAQAMTIGEQQ